MKFNQTIIKNNEHFKNSIKKTVQNNSKEIYSYLNTYTLYLSDKQTKFNKCLEYSNYLRIGGIGTKIYYKLSYNLNIEKVTFNHFFMNFGGNKFLSENFFSVYCLGGTDSVINNLKKRFADERINLVGYRSGFFSESDSEYIIQEINRIKPQILLVGLGTPLSDYWTNANKDKLPNCAIIHVGNFFDLITKKKKIAPKFLYNSGLEWIFRLIQEPKRLFSRYAKSNFHLVFQLIKLLYK